MEEKWVTFWFDGNLAWGVIQSKLGWDRIVRNYMEEDIILLDAKRDDNKVMPTFGFSVEHKGETLKQFADRNKFAI